MDLELQAAFSLVSAVLPDTGLKNAVVPRLEPAVAPEHTLELDVQAVAQQ